jgi:hypothetical protein
MAETTPTTIATNSKAIIVQVLSVRFGAVVSARVV